MATLEEMTKQATHNVLEDLIPTILFLMNAANVKNKLHEDIVLKPLEQLLNMVFEAYSHNKNKDTEDLMNLTIQGCDLLIKAIENIRDEGED